MASEVNLFKYAVRDMHYKHTAQVSYSPDEYKFQSQPCWQSETRCTVDNTQPNGAHL